jgi:hypothetical protein
LNTVLATYKVARVIVLADEQVEALGVIVLQAGVEGPSTSNALGVLPNDLGEVASLLVKSWLVVVVELLFLGVEGVVDDTGGGVLIGVVLWDEGRVQVLSIVSNLSTLMKG